MQEYLLKTDRLDMREFAPEDAPMLFALNLDPEVIRYTGDPPFSSVEDAADFIASYDDYLRNGFGRWAVIDRDRNEFVGWCGLKRHEDGMVDIGFRFFQKEWGKGFATESARAVLEYGFGPLGLKEIVGRAAKANTASVHVLKKLGMIYWKAAPCHGIADAAYYRIFSDKS